MSEPVVRPAARVVILDPDDNILLQRIATPEGWDGWITPGGAIEEGETPEEAACRELVEEIGLRDVSLGPAIWTRRHVFPWSSIIYDQRETFYLVRLQDQFVAAPTVSAEQLADEGVVDQAWWSLNDLDRVETAPRNLVSLVRGLIANGPPPNAVEIGV